MEDLNLVIYDTNTEDVEQLNTIGGSLLYIESEEETDLEIERLMNNEKSN